jgi:holin-like protein
MKYFKQFGIIAGVSFVGELLYAALPFPIPASVYGLVLMVVLLMTKIVKLEMIEETADFMISMMGIFFIPSSVGLMNSFDVMRGSVVQLLLTCAISTVVVMVVTGLVAQVIITIKQKKEGK